MVVVVVMAAMAMRVLLAAHPLRILGSRQRKHE